MTILDSLKSTTAAAHERVETLLALGGALPPARYDALLVAFRALYAPLEARVARRLVDQPAAVAALVANERRKLPRLDRDLAARRLATPADAPADALPPLGTVGEALGAVYVIEGATLGGRVIARGLERSLGIAPDSGGAFFGGYGERTGPMWTAFRDAITGWADAGGAADDVLRGATATFEAFERWFSAQPDAVAVDVGAARG